MPGRTPKHSREEILQAIEQLRRNLGRLCTTDELCDALGGSRDLLHRTLSEVRQAEGNGGSGASRADYALVATLPAALATAITSSQMTLAAALRRHLAHAERERAEAVTAAYAELDGVREQAERAAALQRDEQDRMAEALERARADERRSMEATAAFQAQVRQLLQHVSTLDATIAGCRREQEALRDERTLRQIAADQLQARLAHTLELLEESQSENARLRARELEMVARLAAADERLLQRETPRPLSQRSHKRPAAGARSRPSPPPSTERR